MALSAALLLGTAGVEVAFPLGEDALAFFCVGLLPRVAGVGVVRGERVVRFVPVG